MHAGARGVRLALGWVHAGLVGGHALVMVLVGGPMWRANGLGPAPAIHITWHAVACGGRGRDVRGMASS